MWLTCCLSYRLPFIFITIYGIVCVQLAHFSICNWNDISIAHVIIIIKSEVSTFLIFIIFFRGCVPEMSVTSYSVTYCIYVPWKPGICFHYYCEVYDECKYSDMFWLAGHTCLFVPLDHWGLFTSPSWYWFVNFWAPRKFEWNFGHVIFKQILVIDDWDISCEIALAWKPRDLLMISQHWFR